MNTHTSTPDLLRSVRNWHPSHDDAISLLTGLASCFKHSQNGLGDKCRAMVIDLLDQAADEVEQDKVEQEAEQAWADNNRRLAA